MLLVISPAKKLDFTTPNAHKKHTQVRLLEQSKTLIDVCKALTPTDIASLMKLSDTLAGLNVARFAQWQPQMTLDNAKQAIDAFKGDVYAGMECNTLSDDARDWLQKHLRILSGLYGVLRPLDLIMAYRLEMGTRLANPNGNNLYQYWDNIITDLLLEDVNQQGDNILINLASNEYFKAVKKPLLKQNNIRVITPVFKDQKNGQYKMISFYAKKARGMMTRYIVDNRITDAEQLKDFDCAGYYYVAEASTDNELVFYRDE